MGEFLRHSEVKKLAFQEQGNLQLCLPCELSSSDVISQGGSWFGLAKIGSSVRD